MMAFSNWRDKGMLIGVIAVGTAMVMQSQPSIDEVVQSTFKDATLVASIDSMNQRELVKIKKDFATQYRVKTTKLWLKEPHQIRIEAKVEDTNVLYIVNGAKRYWRIPRAGLNGTENNDKAPGKRQTFLDFGLLTPSMFRDPFTAKFVRVDRASGDLVFDVTYPAPKYDDSSRYRIWVDPDKKFTTKREWYSQGGRFLATFVYEAPVNQKGVWMPTKCTVKNAEGKVAGVTSYDQIVVNSGIADSQFKP